MYTTCHVYIHAPEPDVGEPHRYAEIVSCKGAGKDWLGDLTDREKENIEELALGQ